MACVVRGCGSHSSRNLNSDEIAFHRFPKDETLKNEWISRIDRANWTPKTHSHICSKHFTDDSFIVGRNGNKWRRLREDAVPTWVHINTDKIKSVTKRISSNTNLRRKVEKLQKELERVKNISKRRLRKINTLNKRVTELVKRNEDIFNSLTKKLIQEKEITLLVVN